MENKPGVLEQKLSLREFSIIKAELPGMWVDELTVDQQGSLKADHSVFDPFRFLRPFNQVRPFS